MQKSKTHFQQIPVELVKKIAKEHASDDNDEKDGCGDNNWNQQVEAASFAFAGENPKRV